VCMTREEEDVRKAHEAVCGKNIVIDKARYLDVLVKILSEKGLFGEARGIAREMEGMDKFWHHDARLWILRFSGLEEDRESCEKAFDEIISSHARAEAYANRNLLLTRHLVRGKNRSKYFAEITALIRLLNEFKGIEDAHRIGIKYASAALRWKIDEIVSRLAGSTTE